MTMATSTPTAPAGWYYWDGTAWVASDPHQSRAVVPRWHRFAAYYGGIFSGFVLAYIVIPIFFL